MQVSNVSTTNFGILIKDKISLHDNVTIKPQDRRQISQIVDALNAYEARGITVHGEIGQTQDTSGSKSMRISTTPTNRDMEKIHAFRPDATVYDYKRRTKWVDLYSPYIIDIFNDFLRRQKGFIHHCTKDVNHRAEPFDNPVWRPDGIKHSDRRPKRYLGDA